MNTRGIEERESFPSFQDPSRLHLLRSLFTPPPPHPGKNSFDRQFLHDPLDSGPTQRQISFFPARSQDLPARRDRSPAATDWYKITSGRRFKRPFSLPPPHTWSGLTSAGLHLPRTISPLPQSIFLFPPSPPASRCPMHLFSAISFGPPRGDLERLLFPFYSLSAAKPPFLSHDPIGSSRETPNVNFLPPPGWSSQ